MNDHKRLKPKLRSSFGVGNVFSILYFLSISLFFVSLIIQVYLSNKYTIKSDDIVSLETKKIALEQEISKLEQETTAISSLSKIESKALVLGFIKSSVPLSVVSTPPLAAVPNLQ